MGEKPLNFGSDNQHLLLNRWRSENISPQDTTPVQVDILSVKNQMWYWILDAVEDNDRNAYTAVFPNTPFAVGAIYMKLKHNIGKYHAGRTYESISYHDFDWCAMRNKMMEDIT